MYARASLVHGVDSLVGLGSVGDITLCQSDTCADGIIGKGYMMVLLVAVLDIIENLQGLLHIGGFYEHLLETALQGSVLLNAVAVLVERGGTNTLDSAACQRRFHDIGSIHTARRAAGTDDGVDLVDEDDDIGILLYLLEKGTDTLLKLSAVLGASHNACHVKTHNLLVEEHG